MLIEITYRKLCRAHGKAVREIGTFKRLGLAGAAVRAMHRRDALKRDICVMRARYPHIAPSPMPAKLRYTEIPVSERIGAWIEAYQ